MSNASNVNNAKVLDHYRDYIKAVHDAAGHHHSLIQQLAVLKASLAKYTNSHPPEPQLRDYYAKAVRDEQKAITASEADIKKKYQQAQKAQQTIRGFSNDKDARLRNAARAADHELGTTLTNTAKSYTWLTSSPTKPASSGAATSDAFGQPTTAAAPAPASAPAPTPAADTPAPTPSADAGGGGVGLAPVGDAQTPGQPSALVGDALRAKVHEEFPAFGWLLDNPGLTITDDNGAPINLLEYAVKKGLSPDQFQARLISTPWYQQNSESARSWDVMLNTDQASAQKAWVNGASVISAAAQRLGIALPQHDLFVMADQYNRFKWSEDDVQHNLASYARVHPNLTATNEGSIKAQEDQLIATASQYLIPLARSEAHEWALKLLDGSADTSTFTGYLTSLATGRFNNDPSIVKAIQQGIAPGTLFAPLKSHVADLLGISPDLVDLTNPKWAPLIDQVGQDGVHRPMTLTEADYWARGLPDFQNTSTYRQQHNDMELGLTKFLGLLPS